MINYWINNKNLSFIGISSNTKKFKQFFHSSFLRTQLTTLMQPLSPLLSYTLNTDNNALLSPLVSRSNTNMYSVEPFKFYIVDPSFGMR